MKNTWVELDLDALSGNIASFRASLPPAADLIFMVKANAYGHGLAPVAGRAWECGVRWFDVAHMWEAEELRRLLPRAEIMVSSVISAADVRQALDLGVVPIIVDEAHAGSLSAEAAAAGRRIRCHAKIDTGMGRLGFDWQTAPQALASLRGMGGLNIEGVCSHLASADEPDRAPSDRQAKRFLEVLNRCAAEGLSFRLRHLPNSAGALLDASWDLDAVRLGIHLYGYPQRPAGVRHRARAGVAARPVLHWKTRLLQVRAVPAGFTVSYGGAHVTPRPTTIGIIDAGYSDGYPRALSNKADVLAGGRRCRVLGRVTMNSTIVDLGPDAKDAPGDEVVLIGTQGAEAVWADELASLAGTIPYEILTGVRAAAC